MGGRKSYNPKNKGKKSYQPIRSFIAETRKYAAGALRTGERPSGQQIADHLESVANGPPQHGEDGVREGPIRACTAGRLSKPTGS